MFGEFLGDELLARLDHIVDEADLRKTLKDVHQAELQMSCQLMGLMKDITQMQMISGSVTNVARQRIGVSNARQFTAVLNKIGCIKRLSAVLLQKLDHIQTVKGAYLSVTQTGWTLYV